MVVCEKEVALHVVCQRCRQSVLNMNERSRVVQRSVQRDVSSHCWLTSNDS